MWLSDYQVVLPDQVLPRGSVRIEEGRIAEIIDQPVQNATMTGEGRWLWPGLVDLHGDMIEREIEPRPGAVFPFDMALVELDKRYVASGITTAYAAVSFSDENRAIAGVRSETMASDIVRTIVAQRSCLSTDLRVHARFEVTNFRARPILQELIEAQAVDLISLTDHTPGQGQFRNIEHYVDYISDKRQIDPAVARARTEQRIAERAALQDVWTIIRDVTDLAVRQDLIVASHDDDSVEKVRLMREMGAAISEFPVTLEAASEARRLGLHTIMGAPNAMRGLSNSDNLSARDAIAAGHLDALAADYHPGAMLQAVMALAENGLLALAEAVALVTAGAAQAAGLDDRGRIEIGRRADLIIVDGASLPRIRTTIRGGRIVFAG